MAEQMIMEEVACLFVEQYEAMFHKDYKVSDVNLIRKTANRGIIEVILRMGEMHGNDVVEEIMDILFAARRHYYNLTVKKIFGEDT